MGRKAYSLAIMRPLKCFLDFSLSLDYPGIIKYVPSAVLKTLCYSFKANNDRDERVLVLR